VSHAEQGTKPNGVREQGSEEDIGPKRDEVTEEWRTLQETTKTNVSPLLICCSEKDLKLYEWIEVNIKLRRH
jgi:hypothetical protein